MKAAHVFSGLMVADLDRSSAWYAALFGRVPDLVPNDREVMWQLAATSNLYLLADPARAGQGVVTIAVVDLDVEVASITERGLPAGPIEVIGDAGRKSVVVDPDGNEVHLIQLTPAPT